MSTTARAIVCIALLVSFSLSVFSQQTAKSIPNSTSPDGLIGFLEFKPKDYGTQKHPLIIFLHGIGERGNGTSQLPIVAYNGIPLYCGQGATMRFTVAGQTSSFVVLSPQLSTSYGYWPPFYVQEMIKYAKANLQIDPDRIYVTGLSLGGGGVWGAITNIYDPTFDAGIAAAAPVCGTGQYDDGAFCSTIGASHLPIWAFHSMDDGVVNVYSTQHAEAMLKACNMTPAPIYTYYQTGGHGGAWINAYDTGHITRTTIVNGVPTSFTANPNLYEWFLSNKRSTTQSTTAYTAPVATAGAAQIITLPVSTVTLTGSGTGTNGATIASYSWAQTSGPAGAVLSASLSTTTLVTGLVQGTYVFTLTVTDNHGLTSNATVTITVNAALTANQNPVSNAGSDVTIVLPTNSVTLDGSASSDADGKIVEYYWSKVSGPAGAAFSNQFAVNPTFSSLVAGTYLVMLQVKDDRGGMAYSGKTITVMAAAITTGTTNNVLPVSVAGANVTITLPTNSVTLDAGASYDSDGKIVQYYWSKANGPAGTLGDPFAVTTTYSNLAQGVHTIVLQVKDDKGGLAYCNKTITVNAATSTGANQVPVAVAGANFTVNLPTTTAVIDAGASYDPDGTIVQYYWKQISGPSVAKIADLFAVNTTLSGLVQGKYIFNLQVRDDKGGLAYSDLIITVAGSGARVAADSSATKTVAGDAALQLAATDPLKAGKLSIYPNPVQTSATIEMNSADNSVKSIYIYTSTGVLAAKYIWQTVAGKNVFTLNNVSGLTNGMYVVAIKDSTGKSLGTLKFLKIS